MTHSVTNRFCCQTVNRDRGFGWQHAGDRGGRCFAMIDTTGSEPIGHCVASFEIFRWRIFARRLVICGRLGPRPDDRGRIGHGCEIENIAEKNGGGPQRIVDRLGWKSDTVHQPPGDLAGLIDPAGSFGQSFYEFCGGRVWRRIPLTCRCGPQCGEFPGGREQIGQKGIMNFRRNGRPFGFDSSGEFGLLESLNLMGRGDLILGGIQLNQPFLSKLAMAFSSPS